MDKPDIRVENLGTVVMLVAESAHAQQWLQDECATEPWQWSGPALAVDPRYVRRIVRGAERYGLEVQHA